LSYSRADFEEKNQGFVDRFAEFYPEFKAGHVLDLGCGPADIPIRLARTLPECRITGVDGSPPMIALGLEAIRVAGLADRITLRCERFQDTLLTERAAAVISNSLLHHVPNPLQFWYAVKKLASPGAVALEFSAEPTARKGAQSMAGKISFQADRWRVEMASPDGPKVAIHRLDKAVTWLLLPNRTYVEMPLRFDQIPQWAPKIQGEVGRTLVATDKVGGRKTEKYEVNDDVQAQKMVVYQWVAPDIKFSMKTASADGSFESAYSY